jgi:hypothetical protein
MDGGGMEDGWRRDGCGTEAGCVVQLDALFNDVNTVAYWH